MMKEGRRGMSFKEWLQDECINNLDDLVALVGSIVHDALIAVAKPFIATITFPLWVIPFIYWCFKVRRKVLQDGRTDS